MPQYTDFLGNPIKDGDTIIYARTRSSASVLAVATVERVIPLVPHPLNSTSTFHRDMLAREDHVLTKKPEDVTRHSLYNRQDAAKQYVALVRAKRRDGEDGRLTQITDVDKIVVVNSLGA